MKWTKFSDEFPKCDWIWISDYENVSIRWLINLEYILEVLTKGYMFIPQVDFEKYFEVISEKLHDS